MRGKAENLTLSDLAALNEKVKGISKGYDNLQAMQKRKKISGTPAAVIARLLPYFLKFLARKRTSSKTGKMRR